MIILDTIFPLFGLLLLGSLLRVTNIIDESFLKTADKLVYYIFFPVMLSTLVSFVSLSVALLL